MHKRRVLILFIMPFWIRGMCVWKERQHPALEKKKKI